MSSEALIALGLACVSFIVWLVRLEGRINTAEKTHSLDTEQLRKDLARVESECRKDLLRQEAEAFKLEKDLRVEMVAIKARQDVDAASHNETTVALVRVEEQLRHLSGMVERLFAQPVAKLPAVPRNQK